MSEQPPVQPPGQPPASTPPTQPLPAAGPPTPVVGSPTSTRGGRWGLGIAAGALACLMILGIGVASVAILRNHDRVNLMGQRQDGYSRGQNGPGNGQGPWANGKQDRKAQKQQRQQMQDPGMPGGQGPGQGLGGLGNLLGGTNLHGDVTGTLNGSVQTLVFQRGQVAAVSDTSITLKSTDGFEGTYGRNATSRSTGAAPVKGGQAFVLARSSDKVAITVIAMPDMAGVGPSN